MKRGNILQKSLVAMFTIFHLYVFCQQVSIDYIDRSLFEAIPKLQKNGNYKEALKLATTVTDGSTEKDYLKGKAWGNFYIANSLCNLEDFKKSNEALKNAKLLNEKLKDPNLDISITIVKGRNYNEEKLSYSLAAKEFRSALLKTKNLKDKKTATNYNFVIYKNLISTYYNLNKVDSAYYYSIKAKSIKAGPYVLNSLTHYHLDISPKKDSALHYLNLAQVFFEHNEGHLFEKTIMENQWGAYHLMLNEPLVSISYSKKALDLAKKVSSSDEMLTAYRNLGLAYQKLGNIESSEKYFDKEKGLKDSLNTKLLKNLDSSVVNIIEYEKEKKASNFSFLIVSTAIMIFLLLLSIWLVRGKKMQDKDLLLAENIISEQSKEIDSIEKKMRFHSEEKNLNIIELAKKNDQSFYFVFCENYPTFQSNLQAISLELSNADLIMSAYIYLGFSTKDIADYTFRSVKTIQNRKNSLRRKLQIDSKQDLYLWFRSFYQQG